MLALRPAPCPLRTAYTLSGLGNFAVRSFALRGRRTGRRAIRVTIPYASIGPPAHGVHDAVYAEHAAKCADSVDLPNSEKRDEMLGKKFLTMSDLPIDNDARGGA